MVPKVWDGKSYKDFIAYLNSIADEKYKEFHSSLVLNSKYEMIGIRVPVMKNIAKEIEEFCSTLQSNIKVAVMGCAVNGIGEGKEAEGAVWRCFFLLC